MNIEPMNMLRVLNRNETSVLEMGIEPMFMLKVKNRNHSLVGNEDQTYGHVESFTPNQTNVWKWESNP